MAGSTTTTYTYDRADRLTAAGALSVTVDAVGNLTARGADTFAYDGANRLTSATVGGLTETYAYDGDGVRVSRQPGANPAIRYVSDVGAGLPVTLDDGTRRYVWGHGLVSAVSGSSIEVDHADRLGSVRALTDLSGTVTAAYRTDEWGVPTASAGSSSQPYGFTGEPTDATGLVYLCARYYDPSLGRFLSRDPLAGSPVRPTSLNRCAYASDNPVTYADPSGLAAPGGSWGPGLGTKTPVKSKVLGGSPPSGGCDLSLAERGGRILGGLGTMGGGVVLAGVGFFLGVAGVGEIGAAGVETGLTGGFGIVVALIQVGAGIGHVGTGVVAIGSGVYVFVQGGEIAGSAFCQ